MTVLAVTSGLGVFAVVLGLHHLVVPWSVDLRLAHFVGGFSGGRPQRAASARGRPPELLASLNRRLTRNEHSANVRVLLQRGDVSLGVADLLLTRVGTALVLGALVALVTIPRVGLVGVALAALAAYLGGRLPLVYVQIRAARRVGAIVAQLPEALDMLVAALQSGAGLSQAMRAVSREIPPPIADELSRVLREVEIGLSMTEALNNLADRLGNDDVSLVVTTINVQSRVGGNLVSILGTINHTIRERLRIRGEVQVATSMQRMSALVISAIPLGLGLILYLISPRYMSRLFEPGLGRALLVASVIMAITGFLVLRQLTDIEV